MNMREEIEEYVSCSMTDEGIWVGDAGSIVAIVERHLAANKRQTEMSTIDEAARGLVEKIGAIGYVEGCDCPTCQSDRRKIVSIIAAAMRKREEVAKGRCPICLCVVDGDGHGHHSAQCVDMRAQPRAEVDR